MERPFFQALTNSFIFNVSLLNSPLIYNLPKSLMALLDQLVAVYNQTYWSIAVYWVNHGFTAVQKAEFELTKKITPLGSQSTV